MPALPERLVRRRRDGILQIRRRGLLDRARLPRDLSIALAVVVLGTQAYASFRLFLVTLVGLLTLWAGRALWRGRHPSDEVLGRRGQVQVIRLEGRRLRR